MYPIEYTDNCSIIKIKRFHSQVRS
jgi:hypothetical protein